MASSMSSSKRRSFSEVDKENVRDDDINDGLESKRRMIDKKEKIRFQIIEEFQKQNLEVPVEMIDSLDHEKTNRANRNDAEHRKELYTRLSAYLDRRRVRNYGETYIFPNLIHQLIRCRFPNDIRAYNTVKTLKNGKLSDVSEENKYHVQWKDFCKKIH